MQHDGTAWAIASAVGVFVCVNMCVCVLGVVFERRARRRSLLALLVCVLGLGFGV